MALKKIGTEAPEFTLPDEKGKEHTLSSYRGKWILLYFYPKDDTPGCTKEACAIRDEFPKFGKLKAKVLGVSADSIEKHFKFKEKYQLPFTLLSDPDKKVIKSYGVWQKKKFMGKESMGIVRSSFLIDPQGKIAKVYAKVTPAAHAEEVLADIKELA